MLQDSAPADDYTQFSLSGDRLILKAITFNYLEDIFREFTPKIATFIPVKPPQKISESAVFIHKSLCDLERRTNITCVITDIHTQAFLGLCALQDIQTDIPSFGLWIKESAQGQGYGLEAITMLQAWARTNLQILGFSYKVDAENIASNKLAQKLGGKITQQYSEDFPEVRKKCSWNVYTLPLS